MATKRGGFSVVIPSSFWTESGPTGAEWSRRSAQLSIRVGLADLYLHLTAIAVYDREDSEQGFTVQIACRQDDQEELEEWVRACNPDGRLDTIKIGDHDYVVFASPHS